MGNNRGDQALRVLTPVAMREIGYALGVGLVGALAWKFTMADSTRARIAKLNKVSSGGQPYLALL